MQPATEVDALAALADVGAEAYSLGQPSTVGGPTLGTPNTFVFAFTGVGGGSAFPEAVPGGPYAVQEGNTVTLDGTGSSVPGGTIASYSWTPAGRLTGATTATPSFAAIDDETVPITLTVCDDQTPARCDTKSTTLLVTNAVPVVNAGPDMGATAGTAVAVSTSFTDAGTLDTHSATVNWGDGTAVTTIATATSPFSRSHTYAAAGTFTVTVCVTDDDGGGRLRYRRGWRRCCERRAGCGDLGAGDSRRGFLDRRVGCFVDRFRRDDRVVCVVGVGGSDVEQRVGAGTDADGA